MKRDSVIFYRSFYESIQTLDLEIQAEVYNAIFNYSLNHLEPDLKGVPLGFFTLIKPQLDANHQRFINGNKQKNKRNGSETEAKPKQKKSERQANANVNANVNVNDNVNENIGLTSYDLGIMPPNYKPVLEKKIFTAPEIDDVVKVMSEKLDDFTAMAQAQLFINHYESNGWKVGKNKMQNWKAAAAGWISRMKQYHNGKQKLGTSAARMEALRNW